MKIEIIKCLQDNYSYLIINETNKKACVVDPGEASPIINFIENNNIKLKYILNTHHHYDHVAGNIELKKRYGSKVVAFKEDKSRIPQIDILVEDNQIWKVKNFEAKIYHIPGHTSGHIAFHFFKEKKKTNENERSVFTKGAYFLGKVVWGKGYHELLDCVEKHNANAEDGQTCPISMDVYGNGEDLESVTQTAMDKELPLNFKGRLDHANPTVHDYKIFVNPSLSDVVATTTAEALAMGKFVVCAKHPSNEFFSSFPNCLTYGNQEEFSQCMKKAFDTEPKPLSAEDAYRLSWEAATDRFLDAAELGPEHKEKQPGLSKVSESVAASAVYALNNIEGVRQALGAGKNTHSIDAPEKLDSNWKPEKWEVAGLASSTKKK